MPTERTSPRSKRRTWTELSAEAGGEDHVVLGDLYRSVSVTVHPGAGGSASLAISCRAPEAIEAGDPRWVDLDFNGRTDLTGSEGSEIPVSVTAVRLSAVTQPSKAFLSAVI